MGKAVFPKALMGDHINESNRKWLDDYKNETDKDPGYYQKIENFFRFRDYRDLPFNTFTKSDVDKYIGIMVDNDYTADTINVIPGALSGFKSFLIAKYPSNFNKDFLSDLPSRYFDEGNPSDAFALSLTQINLLREYNRQNYQNEYIFEIYFQLGIKKKAIVFCQPNNSDEEHSCFKLPNGNEIRYNAKIAELIIRLPRNQPLKLTDVTVNYYLIKVTEYLRKQSSPAYLRERVLNYSDLIKSHQKYIFACPSCGQLTENNAESWVLAKVRQMSDFRLACAVCKGAYYGN